MEREEGGDGNTERGGGKRAAVGSEVLSNL